MSLYHLDPRQAGGNADVAIWPTSKPPIHVAYRLIPGIPTVQAGEFARGDSEAAALAAARAAAGFGHVAEQACEEWHCHEKRARCQTCWLHGEHARCTGETTLGTERCTCTGNCADCDNCAWPRTAHGQDTP